MASIKTLRSHCTKRPFLSHLRHQAIYSTLAVAVGSEDVDAPSTKEAPGTDA